MNADPCTRAGQVQVIERARLLAAHRADVLREAANDFAVHDQYPDETPSLVLRDMAAGIPADEAVADD